MNEPKFLAVLKLKSLIESPLDGPPRQPDIPLAQAGIIFPYPNLQYVIAPEAFASFDEMLPFYLMLGMDENTICVTPSGRALGTVRVSMPFADLAKFLDTTLVEPNREQRPHGYGHIIFLRDEATTATKYLERLHKLAVLTAE